MERISSFLIGILVIILIAILTAFPVMYLWNHVLVDVVSGIKPIGMLQSWGIMILCSLLFKNTITTSK